MTKRQMQSRIREVRKEFLTAMRERFPLVEIINTEIRPTGTVVLRIYAPYEDTVAVLETVSARVFELGADEKLDVMVLPFREKPSRRAA